MHIRTAHNVPSAQAHTGREMSAHKKTWSAHKFSFKKMVFAHISYMSFYM